MKIHTKLECQTLLIFCIAAVTAENDFSKRLTNLWSIPADLNDASRSDSNVVEIQPTSYRERYVPTSRVSKLAHEFKTYVFRPRMIPLNINKPSQGDTVYYPENNVQNKQSNLLLPGNYLPIAEVKSNDNVTEEVTYNPLSAGTFKPMTIPLVRDQGSMKRSLNNEEVITKEIKDESDSQRSLSYIFGGDEEEEEESDGEDYETGDSAGKKGGVGKLKKKKFKAKKTYSKYMTPLLLAYKLKYFALVPVLVSGLILLVGATGLAGFFFALFAAVMGLQKGGDY